ncbi:MAG: hypothetical protein ABIN89_27020 [Chitinophagaceae bacterium]
MTTFACKKTVLLLTAGFFTLTSMAQDRGKFSGEWKLNESKSDSVQQFPLCIFGGGDRMRSRTMKIAGHADFLTVDVASESADGALVTRQEKLTFDGKESEATFVGRPREKSSAKWSDDGQMTVTSVRSFDTNGEKADFKVTEVWKLINEGKSISVQVNSTTMSGGEHTMKLVYDKQRAVDYRF